MEVFGKLVVGIDPNGVLSSREEIYLLGVVWYFLWCLVPLVLVFVFGFRFRFGFGFEREVNICVRIYRTKEGRF